MSSKLFWTSCSSDVGIDPRVHLHWCVFFNIKGEESEGFRFDKLAFTPGIGKPAWCMGDCGLFVAAFCQAGSGANSLRVYMSGHGMFPTGSVSPGSNGELPFEYPHLSRNFGIRIIMFRFASGCLH